ncbi:MAG: TerC family protein [Elusimicrobiota bacterium]|nr:TerC family protein [Elusimicrobiota bacterium]
MNIHYVMWAAFWIIVALALFIDLVIMGRHHGKVTIKEALVMVGAWVSLAALFGGAVWLFLGHTKGLEYFTGYVIEYSLSVDNMFVFIMIFTYFAVPAEYQPKVLLWGILGAVVMRFAFIFAGVQLITRFQFTVYIFGAVLIYTAVKMLLQKEESFNPADMPLLKFFKKIIPLKDGYDGGKFFAKDAGRWFATPLFAAVLVVEGSDLIFAVDSIPAVLSITQDTFIVYTSNIFAIIGLRSLYFLLSGMAGKFEYLKYGIAAVLVFVGVKMIISHYYHIPTWASLCFIAAALICSIMPTLFKKEA